METDHAFIRRFELHPNTVGVGTNVRVGGTARAGRPSGSEGTTDTPNVGPVGLSRGATALLQSTSEASRTT